MLNDDIKNFVNEIASDCLDKLRQIVTDFSAFYERVEGVRTEQLEEMNCAIDFIGSRLSNIEDLFEESRSDKSDKSDGGKKP